jgi:Fe-S cluster assembly protein SufD
MDGTETISEKAGRGMTVQMLNTKAEQAILKTFEDNAARLPGGKAVAELRRAAIGAFASKGLPSRRVEEFKYTDLKANLKNAFPLALGDGAGAVDDAIRAVLGAHLGAEFATNIIAFVDGRGVTAKGAAFLGETLGNAPAWVAQALADDALSASSDLLVNTALFTDGAVIDVPADADMAEPIVIVSAAGSEAAASLIALRHLVRIGPGAKVTLVELDRTGDAGPVRQSSNLTQVDVGEGAEVTHVKIVTGRKGIVNLGHWQVSLAANATYRPFQLTLGEGFVRNGLNIAFNGQHATFDYGAASIVHGQGHADSSLIIDHKVPHCTSRELFKTVLDGQSRAVFQGKVIVRPNAQKTDGKQMAQALMLSPDAEFDSKPELEIYADDVVCGHGSTAAEIDPDLVFYCTSRGIPQASARALLIESFVGEAIEKVEHEGLRDALTAIARDSLAA